MKISKLKLKEIMNESPITIGIDETVSDAMAKIKRHRIREIPVIESGRPVGLVSYTSFIERRSVPISAKVDTIMLPSPRLDEETDLIDAAEALVATGIRGAPVVRGDKMVGFVSRTDILRVMSEAEELKDKKVNQFMTQDPKSITPNEIVRKAQVIMEELNEKALPVVDAKNRIVGVVGMPEVLDVLWAPKADRPARSPKPPRKVYDSRVPTRIRVASVMTRNAVTVSPDDSLEKTVDLMVSKGLSTLFVTENGKLVGVVDQSDLMEQLITLRSRDRVFVQISGIGMREPDVYDDLYELIGKGMRRISKMERPRVFNMHIAKYDQDGLSSKYSIHARLSTGKNMYYVSNSDWDLFGAMSSLLESLETKIRREKDKLLSKRKRR